MPQTGRHLSLEAASLAPVLVLLKPDGWRPSRRGGLLAASGLRMLLAEGEKKLQLKGGSPKACSLLKVWPDRRANERDSKRGSSREEAN